MRDYLSSEIRNVCLLGHSGSGKTSLVEALLHFTKKIERKGKISDGNTALDFDSEEIKRQVSVYLGIAPLEWKDCKINLLDTPGYLDYAGEQAAGLHVADNALIVVSGRDGVQPGTETAVKAVKAQGLPMIFFINKMDEENASFENVYAQLRQLYGKTVIPFEVPIIEDKVVVGSINVLRKKAWYYANQSQPAEVPTELKAEIDAYYNQIIEAVAMTDDDLMEKFFEEEPFSEHELAKGLRIGVRQGEILPIYCGSAETETGIERLLDLITEYLPSYAEKGSITGTLHQVEKTLATNEKESTTLFVFKTLIDPFVGKISYVKVMTGVLSSDTSLINVNKDKPEKIGSIFFINGKHQVAAGKVFTGDICAITKLALTETNDTLATKENKIIYPVIEFKPPMLEVAIRPKSKNDEDKLSGGLQRLAEEDKSLRIIRNSETRETILAGLGEQHIDVLLSKLKEKYKTEVETSEPKVQYRETITGKVVAEGKHKKQSGGAGQYGHVFVEFSPVDSEEMVFEEKVFGGAVPRQYFPAVEAGLRECMNEGVLAGYKVVGVKAVLTDGSYHEVDSKEIAFKSAARLAYREGLPKARPILLEPIGKCEVVVSEEYTGTIVGDLNKRRGIILGMDAQDNGEQKITAEVPMAEMQRYAIELRAMTQGRGEYLFAFERYEPAPAPIADKVIAQAKKEREEANK